MNATVLRKVLTATGYFPDGAPAAGLHLGVEAQQLRRGRVFTPDATWRSQSALTIYFKSEPSPPSDHQIATWRREIWNEGFAPLLWIVSPERIDLYNGFGTPVQQGDAQKHLIQTFENIEASLVELDALAGRLSFETGQFWAQAPSVDRKTSVDHKLLSDLACLERDLVSSSLSRDVTQALIGQVIFTKYLVDRNIVTPARLKKMCGHSTLPPILRDRPATRKLFGWLSETFNGDMFPPSSVKSIPATTHLSRVADFLEAVDPESGQTNLFAYRFDVIPVELISSIYEQFAQEESGTNATTSVHYTPLSLVSLVLDEVMADLTGSESVVDLTCGSGVFLVEALRRLVRLRANGQPVTRDLIRSTLHEQVYGVDISEAAVRVAAFSLYLAALELDQDPQPPHSLRFKPLIGKTLLIGDARTVERSREGAAVLTTATGVKQFDLVVGNPPWSFKGQTGTKQRRKTRPAGTPAQPRGEGLDFVLRATDFAHEKTRFGVILSAMPFFSRSGTGMAASQHVMRLLAPITLVNLSNLGGWLFASATMPAVALFARHRPQRPDQVTVVQIPWTANGTKTHSFEVSPSDVVKLTLTEIEKQPLKLKAAAVGRRRDISLLDALTTNYLNLGERLAQLDTKFRDGLTRGNPAKQTRDAHELKGLKLLQANDIRHFSFSSNLDTFNQARAQWPRSRSTYKAPLVIVKEMLTGGPRTMAAVSERDLIFTDVYFAAALPSEYLQTAHLLAGILSSSLASWFFGLTASEFGIWKRRLLMRDVEVLPVPDFKEAVRSGPGQRLVRLAKQLHRRDLTDADWASLDETVFELYGLDAADQCVVSDGLLRSSWQWESGRRSSDEPCNAQSDMIEYSAAFLSVLETWLSARKRRWMRAEVIDLPTRAAVRIVRFVLEEGTGERTIELVPPQGELNTVLQRIGERMNIRVATALSSARELRIHRRNEVVIIKPAARRYWMKVAALEDADAVVAESFSGGTN